MKIRDSFGNTYEVDETKVKEDPYDKDTHKPKHRLGIYFIVALIVAKIIYLMFETYYNGYVIDMVTSTEVAKNTLDRLEMLGSNISSTGITLLFLPLFYLISKRFFFMHKGVAAIVIVLLSLASFFLVKELLSYATDKIVEANHDKRYESYYIEMFKYGMLTKKLGYSSFIPRENLENLSVKDKIIISNLFLLTNFDKELINKFIGIGKEKFFDIYVHKYFQVNYRVAKGLIEDFAERINGDWRFYNQELEKINKEIATLESKEHLNKKYETFSESLRERYANYKKEVDAYFKALDATTERASKIYAELSPLFKNGRVAYRVRYEDLSKKYFGEVIDPKFFKKMTQGRVLDALERKASRAWKKKHGDLPLNLTQKAFFLHPQTKASVINALNKEGLRVEKGFDYSKKAYVKAYGHYLDSVVNSKKRLFKQKFYKRTEISNVKLGLNYKQFVSLYKKEIMAYNKRKDLNLRLYKMLQNNDLSQFYALIFKPTVRDKYYDRAFPTEQDFETKLQKFGNEAIKMLYIPPFAITVSMIAGMLNFISLLSLFVLLATYHRNDRWILYFKPLFKIALVLMFIFVPYSVGVKNKVLDDYQVLKEFKDTQLASYVSLMNWLLTVESFNYNYFYTPLRSSGLLSGIMESNSYEVDVDEATQKITGLKKLK